MRDLTEADFDSAVGGGVVLVDFSAEWCGPCKALAPMIERVAKDYETTLSVYRVDVDEARSVAARHGVMSVPTLILYRDGKAIERRIGSVREQDLRSMIESQIG